MKTLILALLFSLLFAGSEKPKTIQVGFENGKKLEVELARTFSERAQGLMNRTSLPENSGMLFVFPGPQKLSFWMKNTYIPLTIAYLDENKVIKEIYDMRAQSMMEKDPHAEDYPSDCRCQYALEVNQGWFKKNKIKVGEKVTFAIPSP